MYGPELVMVVKSSLSAATTRSMESKVLVLSLLLMQTLTLFTAEAPSLHQNSVLLS
tara:strand:- start:489 stop:656 length:168 start_codon:yes stop_codon:yes gene_type:complete